MRLACLLVVAFIVIARPPIGADPHYTIDLINDVLREAQNNGPSPKVENGDNNFVARTPVKETSFVLKHTSHVSTIEVVYPELDLSNKPPAYFLKADCLSKSLITPEIEITSPKGTLDFASAEPDWRILSVNKDIELLDFFYKGLLIQSEKKPNYLGQIELGKTLVETTSCYRESLFAMDYFQVGESLISTNFSSLIQSSEDDLDKKILQNIGLVKNLSPQDPLHLTMIRISSQLEKPALNQIPSYSPIAFAKEENSRTLHLDCDQSPYSLNFFKDLKYEPILSKTIETVLSSQDILKTILDVNAHKASQELLSGAYLSDEIQENLQLTLKSQINLSLSKNPIKPYAVLVSNSTNSALASTGFLACTHLYAPRISQSPQTYFKPSILPNSLKTTQFPSYATALKTSEKNLGYPNLKLEQPHWPLEMTFQLTAPIRHPLRNFLCKASKIELEALEVPLFLGATRAVFDRSQMSNLSLNLNAHPIQRVKRLPTISSNMRQHIPVFEKTIPNLSSRTLQLKLPMPSKKTCQTTPFEKIHPLLPTHPHYVQDHDLTTSANQNILTISLLIDLPNPPITNKDVTNLSILNQSTHFAQVEPTQLVLKKLDFTAQTIDLDCMTLPQSSIVLCGSALSNHSLNTISANESNINVLQPSKASIQYAVSFNKKGLLLATIGPLHLSDSNLACINKATKEVPAVHFDTCDFSITPSFKMMTFSAPSSNNEYRFHHAYAPVELLGSTPYEITYCFGSSAMDTNRSNRITHLLLSSLPTLSELDTDDLNDDFMCEVKVAPHMSQDGYIFSARFTASDKEGIDPLPHHIIYLLDRGSSVEGHRFNTFKNAIVKSISQLNSTTLFNVWFFDQKIDTLSHQDLHNTKASIHLTKQLLSKVSQGKKSSFSTLLQALSLLNQKAAESNELYTVILLSNGSMMKNIRLHRESLLELAKIDSSAFSLYTAAVSDHNNLGMLELLAHVGHGELLYTKTHASFPRKFAQLVKKVSRPIATGLHVTCFSDNPSVSLQHMNVVSEQLYADQGYSVYGSTSDLSHINIIIQGERNGRYVNIHKKIPLKNTAGGQNRTEKTYYTRKALSEMIEFIFSNDQTHLIRAKELLSPYGETLASR